MGDSGRPLTNEDFRKIMFTPRPGAKSDLEQQARQRKERKPKPRPAPQGGKPKSRKPASGNEAPSEDEGADYRDRAAERRKGFGINDEADGVGDVLGIHGGGHAVPDLADMSYEDSKYLGGDLEHTHLVKGLDYALLSKVRSEQGGFVKQEGNGKVGQEIKFAGPVGRAVYNILFDRDHQRQLMGVDVAERFLPRRTAFVFNMEGSGDPFEVPTTLLRAKEDCPEPPKIVQTTSDKDVLDRLAKIMAYMAMGSGGKKKIKKEKRQELLAEAGLTATVVLRKGSIPADEDTIDTLPSLVKPVDDDEDIFADAGTDYVVERRKKDDGGEGGAIEEEQGAAIATESIKRSYFGEDGAGVFEEDLPPVAQPMVARAGPGAAAYPEADKAYPDTDAAFADAEARAAESKRKQKEREARRRQILEGDAADDGYAECYPSYYDAAGMLYDSEDDDGSGKAKKKGGAEDEAGPKKDGLAARREAARLAMKEKLKQDSDLLKLQKVFEEKGYGNTHAFGKKKEGGEKRSEGGGDGEASALPAPTKRRRI